MLKIAFILSVLSVLSAHASTQYGGWSGLSGKKTGFFHVEQLDGRWWCIDPTGAAFFSIGTDHVNYNVHWCEALGYAPYAQNIRKKYNNDESAWAKSATDRLKKWNFNALGANNSPSTRDRGLAYMGFLGMGSEYAGKDSIVEKVYWTGVPNVFNPAFAEFCRQKAEKECAPAKDDPWLFGWFIDNELEWFGKGGGDVGIATEAIKLPATHEAKKALVELLKGKYADIGKFNSAWGTSFGSWEDALNSTAWNEKANEVTADKLEFVRLCADRYFAITTDAIRKADPNHMIIGCRFAGNAPPIWDIAGKYCDIVSLNYYGQVDLGTLKPINLVEDLTRWYKDAKRPLMLTEWSFPALDAGLPSKHGAGMRVRTQADKAKCFEVYQKTFFRLPFMVGSDYFMWVDEPALGIAKTFPEDSNYGLVDVNDEPWKLFTEAVTRVNAQAYQIHSGKTSELSIESPDPRTLKIRNTGIVSAKTSLSIWIDGKESERTVSVPAHGESTVEADVPPGMHYLEAAVDPEGKLVEINRGDNRLTKMVYVSEGAASKGKAVIGVLASSQSVVFIPVSRLLKSGSLRLLNSAGKEIEAEVFDLDGSGTITSADEVVFQAEPGKQPETLYVDSGPSTIKLVTPKSVQSFDLSGKLRLAKNTGSGTAIDLVEMGGIHMGSFEVLMQQVAGGTWWQRPNKVKSIRLWEGSLGKRVEVSVSNTDRGDGAGPFAYDATYAFEFYPDRQWFTARFVSLTNTDSRPWTLGSYFYYPLSAIGGDSKDDEADPPGAGGVAAWTNSKIGAAYGIIARPATGVQVYFWKDEAGGEHSDARAQIDKPLKPGETRLGKTPPAYIFCASTKDDPQPWRSIELGIESLPKWEVFKP